MRRRPLALEVAWVAVATALSGFPTGAERLSAEVESEARDATASLSGRVIDASGAAVARATIKAIALDPALAPHLREKSAERFAATTKASGKEGRSQ